MRWHFRYIGYCLLFARKKLWLKHPNEHSVAFWSPHWTSSHLFILDTISLVLCNVFFAVHRRYITITFIQPFLYISFYCMAMFISFVCYYMCYFSFSSNCWCRNWKWLSKMRSYCNNLGRQRKWKHNWCFRLNFLKVQWVGQYFTRDSSVERVLEKYRNRRMRFLRILVICFEKQLPQSIVIYPFHRVNDYTAIFHRKFCNVLWFWSILNSTSWQ